MEEYRPFVPPTNSQTNDIEDKRRHKFKTMDKTNIRKRAAEDSEYFESKISREAAKIIQIKVSQEAVNVQLQDNIKTLESKIEKQDRALINSANENEHLKSEYQKEIRQREDTVNTVVTSRKICNVLEEHFGRVAKTLTRCQNESKFLSEYYQRVVEEINSKEEKYKATEKSYLAQIEALHQNLTHSNEMKQQLSESWSENKKTLEVLIEELRTKNASKDEQFAKLKAAFESLVSEHNALTAEAASYKSKINQNSDTIQDLLNKLNVAKKQYTDEINVAGQYVGKCKEEISNLTEELKRTKEAVVHQEDFIVKLGKENVELTEKLAQLEELNKEGQIQCTRKEEAKEKLETEYQIILTELNNIKQRNAALMRYNEDNKQFICKLEAEKVQIQDKFNKEMNHFDSKQKDWFLSKAEMEDQLKILLDQNEELSKSVKEHLKTIEFGNQQNIDHQNEMKKMKNDIEAQINETVKDKVMDLVSEVKTLADIRYKLERNVDILKKDLESSKQKEKDIAEKHENAIITIDDLEQNIHQQMQQELIISEERVRLLAHSKKLKETLDRLNADFKAAKEKQEEDKNEIALLNEQLRDSKKLSASQFSFDKPMSLKSPINTNITLTKRVPSPPLTPLPKPDESTQNSKTIVQPITSEYKVNRSGNPRISSSIFYVDEHGVFSDSSLDSCSSYNPKVTSARGRKFKNIHEGGTIQVSYNKALPKKKVQSKSPQSKKITNKPIVELEKINLDLPKSNPSDMKKFFKSKR